MLLENKTAIIYGAGGAIGAARLARTFAREGAKVFLSGRTLSKVERVAQEIVAAGGTAEASQVDALNEEAVESHVAKVFEATGRLDVSFNAITVVPQRGPRAFRSRSCRWTPSSRRSPSTCVIRTSRPPAPQRGGWPSRARACC